MSDPRYHLSQGVSVHEHEGEVYISTVTDEYKINQTIAVFLGLLHEPKTAAELVCGLQARVAGADPDTLAPLVARFLKDMHRLEVISREGDRERGPLTPHFQPGARVGHYQITDLLSQHDHLVQVYRATDCESGEPVVLKMFSHRPEDLGEDRRLVEGFRQFQQEFDIMRALPAHPCVCGLRAFYDQPYPFAVLEYLPGESLSECLEKDAIAEAGKAPLATQILAALAHLHAHGVVHGDIHSRNFVVHGQRVSMVDFGFAHRQGVSADEQSINYGGVPTYLAPERIRQHSYKFSKQAADVRAEVYQIALVLFKLYHKDLPFVGETWRQRAASIASYDFGQHLHPAVPHEQVLLRALEKDPSRRYADGQELLAAWQQALAAEAPAASETADLCSFHPA